MTELIKKSDRTAITAGRVLTITLALCGLPFIAIIGLKAGLSSRYSPKSVDGCYLQGASPTFVVRGGTLVSNGVNIASAKLSFFKYDPYLSIDPGINISADGTTVTTKTRQLAEHYPFRVNGKTFSVEIINSDGESHVLDYKAHC